MNFMNIVRGAVFSLVLLGALNWGFIGAFNFNLVSFLFGDMTLLTRIIYSLIGISAVGYFILALKDNMECSHYNC